MSDISFNYNIELFPDPDYHYEVSGSDDGEAAVVYHEDRERKRTEVSRLSFGSLGEMEAVANAMLKVVELAKSK